MLKWIRNKKKKKIQTSKLITVFLLFIWTITWLFGMLQTNKDVSLLSALYSYVQGCLVATLHRQQIERFTTRKRNMEERKMEFLMNNWYMILALIAVLFILSLVIMNWLKLPRAQQIANIKEWLFGAVAEAEKQLGGGKAKVCL